MLRRLALSLWAFALGMVVLFVFFTLVAEISPRQVGAVTAAMAAVAILFTIRTLRVAGELRDRGGDPSVRDEYNRARERRGF